MMIFIALLLVVIAFSVAPDFMMLIAKIAAFLTVVGAGIAGIAILIAVNS
jgi:hypothetical protein